jgi:hypothetical protein
MDYGTTVVRHTPKGINMPTRQLSVQRWSITSRKPFDVVVAAVEGAIGRPNMVDFAGQDGRRNDLRANAEGRRWQR